MALRKEDLKLLSRMFACKKTVSRRRILREGGKPLMRALREISYNVLKGKLLLTSKQLTRLKKHKKCVRLVANKNTSDQTRAKIAQKGGFVGALIAPLLPGLVGPTVNALTGNLR